MSITLAGNTSVRPTGKSREWTSREGWVSVQKFYGLKGDILGWAATLLNEGHRVRIDESEDDPNATLEVRVDDALDGAENAAEELEQTWEKVTNLLEKDLYTFPGIGATPEIRAATIAGIKQAVDEVQAGTATVADYTGIFATDIANRIYLLKVQGVESYQVPQYVIRRTTTLKSQYPTEWPETNILKQWTETQLIADYAIPANRKFLVNEGAWRYQGVLSNTQQPNGKWVVIEEWWHADEWDDLLYPARDAELVPEQGGGG